MSAEKPYLTRADVATALGIGRDAVKHLHDRLPHILTLGGHRRFDPAGVEAEARRRALPRNAGQRDGEVAT